MAECIIMGSGGGGVGSDEVTARAADVVAGKTYLGADTDDETGVGTMPNRGAMQRTLRAGESVTVPQGYHNGSGTVSAASLAEQTAGSAGAGDILAGKSAWVNGGRVDGSIPVFNTMGPSGTDPRGSLTTEYGLDFNARTLWMHAPAHNAYYMRKDGYPHICMDSDGLGDATAQQVLQGCTFTSRSGLKIPGAMYRWPLSGDIGGQKVMDAYENAAFIGDYGARGVGVFMRMPGGSQIDPSCMWAWAPMPGAIPSNIRAGADIGGRRGTLVDYAASCVPFDGARFDGVHLSGWADGDCDTSKRFRIGPTGRYQSARTAYARSAIRTPYGDGEPALLVWLLTPSVALQPFRRALVTVSYSTNTTIMGNGNGVNLWAGFSRINGVQRSRTLEPIREAAASYLRAQSGRAVLEIPLDGVTEQGFLVVAAHGSNFRQKGGEGVFDAHLERIELIA